MSGSFGLLRLGYRLPLLLLHVLLATPLTVLCQARWCKRVRIGDQSLSAWSLKWWGGGACRIFGVRRRVEGVAQPGAQLIAANHISWIDIPLLQSVAGASFVAKAEIERWPLIGWLAQAGETVFHERGNHDSASGVLGAVAERLRQGACVAVFPEGGILPGPGVKRFHARMFGAAIEAGAPVQPVMVRYSRGGALYEDITFRPREHFAANFLRLLTQRTCLAEVRLLPAIPTQGEQRRRVAMEAERLVSEAYRAELPLG